MPQVIAVDIAKCMGCHSCEVACAVAHGASPTLHEAIQQEQPPEPRMVVVAIAEAAVPLHCQHCADAPCATVCPQDAIQRPDPDGPVILDEELCVGCGACAIVCPFGMIRMTADGKTALKCDMCIDRQQAGQPPACVEACPTGALQLIEDADLATEVQRRILEAMEAALQEHYQQATTS